MAKLFQATVLQQARSYSQKTFHQLRTGPTKDSANPESCRELCAEKKKLLDIVQDLSPAHQWKHGTTSGNTRIPDPCAEICKEKSQMMSMMERGQLPSSSGEAGSNVNMEVADLLPTAVLTSVQCSKCGCTFCCVCASLPMLRVLNSQYWSRPQDKYRLNVSVSIREKVRLSADRVLCSCLGNAGSSARTEM